MSFPPAREHRANLMGALAYVARYGRVTPAESGDWPRAFLTEFHGIIADFVSRENEVQESE